VLGRQLVGGPRSEIGSLSRKRDARNEDGGWLHRRNGSRVAWLLQLYCVLYVSQTGLRNELRLDGLQGLDTGRCGVGQDMAAGR
jgi:hypothetical protein